MVQIRLKETDNKLSNNADSFIRVGIDESKRMLPTDDVVSTIDQYQRFVEESDKSNLFRFVFTINPVCTNVLFNSVSEIVYKEGSDECVVFDTSGSTSGGGALFEAYHGFKDNETLNRNNLINDTAYSHSEIGPFVYHCGYDIFGNHYLRAKEFTFVNKDESSKNADFNTLFDFARNFEGEKYKDFKLSSIGASGETEETPYHIYQRDTIMEFSESIDNNLIEKDGWIGFRNKSTIKFDNFSGLTLNRCMNNNKPCEFIDMYPDRSLYSFVPKYNKYRRRDEYNWKYTLTYPWRCEYDNELVADVELGVNGLYCEFCESLSEILNEDNALVEGRTINVRTHIKNNLEVGDRIKVYIVYDTDDTHEYKTVDLSVKVSGIVDNEYKGYMFSILFDDILDELSDVVNTEGVNADSIHMRICKIENGEPLKYYIRMLRKVPNFKWLNVNQEDGLSEEEIRLGQSDTINSNLNKLAFASNVFGDQIAQIVYEDDIDLTSLRDNLNREVSEVSITIVKANEGYDKWYGESNYTDESIEYSHCFGKVTAGVNIPFEDVDPSVNYNIHKMHNVDLDSEYDGISLRDYIQEPSKSLEVGDGITIDDDEFYGDICALNKNTFTESVVDDIYFRFNTAQRETNNTDYSAITYDDILYDDYEVGEFSAEESSMYGVTSGTSRCFTRRKFDYNRFNRYVVNASGTSYSYSEDLAFVGNVFPEGYYYKPHYFVKIRDYEDNLNQGSHTRVSFRSFTADTADSTVKMITSVNYFFEKGSVVYLYDKNGTNALHEFVVTDVSGDRFTEITIKTSEDGFIADGFNLKDYKVFKKNPIQPAHSFDFHDGSGMYVWKNVKSCGDYMSGEDLYDSMFTNGAHYFHKGINFYLRRQDPYGVYGLSYNPMYDKKYSSLIIYDGPEDYSYYDYNEEDKDITCK